MRHAKLYTRCMNKALLTCSDDFSRYEDLYDVAIGCFKMFATFFISHKSRVWRIIKP